jgi:hypothetical protein
VHFFGIGERPVDIKNNGLQGGASREFHERSPAIKSRCARAVAKIDTGNCKGKGKGGINMSICAAGNCRTV